MLKSHPRIPLRWFKAIPFLSRQSQGDPRQTLGRIGERLAERYLCAAGMRLHTRNWRCSFGEIDLILWDKDELVFVEVKTRTASRHAVQQVFDSLTVAKRKRLRRLVSFYLYRHYWRRAPAHRIDAVGVVIKSKYDRMPIIQHVVAVDIYHD